MSTRRPSTALNARDSVELELPNLSGRLVYKVQLQQQQQQPPNVPKTHPRISAIAAESSGGGHGQGSRRASSPTTSASSFSCPNSAAILGSPSPRSSLEIRQNQQNAQLLRKNLAYSASASANLGSGLAFDTLPTFLRRKSSIASSLRSVQLLRLNVIASLFAVNCLLLQKVAVLTESRGKE